MDEQTKTRIAQTVRPDNENWLQDLIDTIEKEVLTSLTDTEGVMTEEEASKYCHSSIDGYGDVEISIEVWEIKELLAHQNAITSARYTRQTASEEKIREILDKCLKGNSIVSNRGYNDLVSELAMLYQPDRERIEEILFNLSKKWNRNIWVGMEWDDISEDSKDMYRADADAICG